MADLGKAYVQIVPSAEGISGSIQNVLSGEADAAGKGAGLKIAGALKKIILSAGIGTALKKTLDFGAELQQNLGGTEAVFGKYADNLQTKARDAYKNMGLSASDYMATANKMGSLFQGSGVEQVRSLQLTQDAMQRAADVASVMGIDMSMAMESIAGAAKGNFTMMDNLGVAMNATTLQAYALEKGINFDWNTADNAQKAELAMQMFMERTKQYEGNFAKESEATFSGSIGAMKAAAQDLMGNLMLGENVTASMQNLATTITTFIGGNLLPAIGNIMAGLPTVVITAVDTLIPTLTAALSNAASVVQAQFPQMLQSALLGLVSFSENIRSKAGDMVNAGLDLIKSLASGIIQNIPTIIETVPTIISNFAGIINDNAPKIIETGISIIKSLAVGIVQAIPVLIANIPKILMAIWDLFTAFQWLNLGKMAVQKIGSGITSGASAVWKAIKGLMTNTKSTVISGFSSLTGKVTSIWKGISNAISHPIQTAVGLVKAAVAKIKSALSGKISLPHIKLPHFSISGKFSLNPPSVPKLSVSWYRKAEDTPYLFRNATLFGAGEGTKDEILYGRSSLLRDIREATSDNRQNVQITNYVTVDGAESPEDYANRLVRQMQLNMRMV